MKHKSTFEAAGEARLAAAEGHKILAEELGRAIKRLFTKLFSRSKNGQAVAK